MKWLTSVDCIPNERLDQGVRACEARSRFVEIIAKRERHVQIPAEAGREVEVEEGLSKVGQYLYWHG